LHAGAACAGADSAVIEATVHRKAMGRSMKARITVTLKSGVLDPQGKAIEGALKSMGVAGVASVRQGKVFDIELDARDRKQAQALLKEAADKLLANTLIENYDVELLR
jgi:phosphoribosylformylglycinamidine synthase